MPTITSGRGLLVALFLFMLLVAVSLLWGSYDGYRAQEQFQRDLSAHSARDAASEIAEYIERQRKALTLMAEGRGDLFARLAAQPGDRKLQAILERLLEDRFSEYHAYSLATSEGELLTDLGEDIANRCREDLLKFAQDDAPYRPYIHPTPNHYHYDILSRWRDGYENGIFFVSFKPDRLASLLKSNQIPGHRLLLVKTDMPGLIEVTDQGGRDLLQGHFHLDDEEMRRIASLGGADPVEGTEWRVVDDPGSEALDAALKRMRMQMGGIGGVFTVLVGLIVVLARREHRRQLENEARRQNYQTDLEQQVAARTADLAESRAQLEQAQAVAQVGSWSRALPGDQITGSGETYRIFAANPGAPIDLAALISLVHPDDQPRLRTVFSACGEAQGCDLEFRISPGGTEKWVHLRGEPRRDPTGRIVANAGSVQDITARKRVQKALLESEARANLMLDAVPEAMLVVDANGVIVRVNRYATQVFGYGSEEMVGRPVEMLMPERSRAAHPALRGQFMGREASRMMGGGAILHGQRRDGSEFPVEVGLQSLVIDGEHHAIATVIDISERRRAELELMRYAQIVETSGDLLAFVDRDMRYTVANPAYAALFDITPEALKGRTLREMFGEEMFELVGAYMDRALAGRDQRFTSDRVFPDGRHHVLDVEYRPFRDGDQVVGVVVSIRDITSRVVAERALRDSELKMRAMLNTPFLFIGLLDIRGNVLQVNTTALKLADKKEIEVAGLPFWDTPWFTHDAALRARLRSAVELAANGESSRFELTYRTAQGEIRDAEMALQPLRNSEGKVIWLVPQGIDITERKATDTLLQRDREQQSTLRALLETILKGGSLEETLERCLSLLLEMSWLSVLPKGGIFLMDPDGPGLKLVVSRGLSPQIRELCAHVPMGRCHCGQAALTGQLQYSGCVDQRHEISYPGMSDHGHYSVPMTLDGKILGVLVFYLTTGFQRDPAREEFLDTVADILASFLRRKRDEQALRDSEDLTRAVMDSLNSSIAVLDGQGNILRVNRSWRDFSRENGGDEVLGGGIGNNYLEATRRAAETADEGAREALIGMMEIMEGKRNFFSLEYPCHSPDQKRWFQLQVTPLGGSVRGLVTSQTDITQRKLAELELDRYQQQLEEMVEARTAELRATEEQVRLILESTADGLFGIDLDGDFTFVNPVASAMLGYPAEALIGRNIHRTIHHSHPDGTPFEEEDCHMLATLRDGRVVRRASETFWRADGSPLPVSYATHPMVRDGRIVGSVVSFTDITTLRESEAAREKALMEAERLARVRSEFLANMSHEIRTPLNAVLGLAQVGARESEKRKANETFSQILDSGQLLLGIVNDILDFSKIEAGRLKLELRVFSPAEVIDRAIAMVAANAYGKGLEFRLEESADLPEACTGDALRLSQILVNLLSNAVKFTQRGHVALSVAMEGSSLYFRVEDSGIGMSREEVARLFIPFEQADGSTTRKFGGTGLGLAISKRLVNLMGGDLDVTSEAGVGSVFTVRVPLSVAVSRVLGDSRPRVALEGFEGAEREGIARRLAAWGLDLAARAELAAGTDLALYNGASPGEELRGALEADARRGIRCALLVTPGNESERAVLPENIALVERPLRVRHLLHLCQASIAKSETPGERDPRRLAGIAVLGAEDNEINRLVLEELLKSEGASLTCLENGAEALKHLEAAGPEAFDIVLTDIQMPVMDGYETARGVHAVDPTLPVIGITAHAMAEERSRCLAAGMVEHVAKPVELEVLVAAILRHARRRAATAVPAAPAPAPAPAIVGEPAPIDDSAAAAGAAAKADLIDWVRLEARFNGKRAFVDKLVATAVASQRESPDKLRAAAAEADFKGLAFLAHGLKGMGGNLMADELHALAARAEVAAKNGAEDTRELAEQLAQAMERLLAELARHDAGGRA